LNDSVAPPTNHGYTHSLMLWVGFSSPAAMALWRIRSPAGIGDSKNMTYSRAACIFWPNDQIWGVLVELHQLRFRADQPGLFRCLWRLVAIGRNPSGDQQFHGLSHGFDAGAFGVALLGCTGRIDALGHPRTRGLLDHFQLPLVHPAGCGDQHEPERAQGCRHVEGNIMVGRALAAILCRFMRIHFPVTTGPNRTAR